MAHFVCHYPRHLPSQADENNLKRQRICDALPNKNGMEQIDHVLRALIVARVHQHLDDRLQQVLVNQVADKARITYGENDFGPVALYVTELSQ